MRTLGACRVPALVVCLLAVASAASPQTTTPTVAEAERLLKQAADPESAGRYRDGIPVAERAASLLETSLGPGDLRVANAAMVVGTLQFRAGNYSAAATAFARALAIREKSPDAEPLAIATSLGSLANAKRGTGQLVEASELFERSLAIQEKALGKEHLDVARTQISYGSLLDARGDSAGAQACCNARVPCSRPIRRRTRWSSRRS